MGASTTLIWAVVFAITSLTYGLDLKYSQFLSSGSNQNPQLKWGTNATHIDIELTYPSRGWIAMGLSPNGAMDKSDVLFGYVEDRTGKVIVQDRFLNADKDMNVDFTLDDAQDWKAVSGSQNATHTTIRALRKLQTCDQADRPIVNAKTHVLYSWNNRDPASDTASVAQHNVRGAYTLNFVVPKPAQAPPAGQLTLNFTMQHTPIRAGTVTQYTCRYVKVPEIKQKYHIIADRPIIDPRNQKFLHHLILYWCNGVPEGLKMEPFDCGFESNETMPKCPGVKLLGGWAAGGQGTTYPTEAGIPVVPADTEQWVYIQAHYNNADLKEKEDNSGMSFTLTSHLRKYDMGTFGTGVFNLDYLFTLPPGQPNFKYTSHCSDKCTSKAVPSEGITVVSGLLHMHQRGTKLPTKNFGTRQYVGWVLDGPAQGKTIVARHLRGGTELPPLLQDMSYDYNFQTVNDVTPPRKFLPGDRIVFECVFTSEMETAAVFGGEATSEEMCLAYFNYYPEVNFSSCGTLYRPSVYFNTIDIPYSQLEPKWSENPRSKTIPLETILANDTLALEAESDLGRIAEGYFADHDWTKDEIDRMAKLYSGSEDGWGFCMYNDTSSFIDDDDPPVLPPYEDPTMSKGCDLSDRA